METTMSTNLKSQSRAILHTVQVLLYFKYYKFIFIEVSLNSHVQKNGSTMNAVIVFIFDFK